MSFGFEFPYRAAHTGTPSFIGTLRTLWVLSILSFTFKTALKEKVLQ